MNSVIPLLPILTTLVFPYLALRADRVLPPVALGAARWLGLPLVLAGLLLAGASATRIYGRGQWPGAPTPLGVPRRLVTEGPYRRSRNPMLLGVVLVVLGEALLLQSPGVFLYLLLGWGALHLFVVVIEEPRLARVFEERYRRYRAEVPRWLPRPRAGPPARDRSERGRDRDA
ncbi:MAG: isoprenylcysteine carboxylmethyltransferase family protein [Deltaproteobacteria bacterium]|nr:isoprenylcysteine carboxylmethyltransferase family protein [Deltaproteobacteria bacterium]MBI3078978.1 isoprenylcysteine carboxylmethyltransferase family protein [Deltaproteobacteria bacterium]